MTNIYYQKTKKGFQKRLKKDTEIFLEKKKTKSASMLVSSEEIFLGMEKKDVNMIVISIKIF